MRVSKNIPKLRFKGFNDEWKAKKLGEVINVKSSKYNPEKESKSYKCIELEHLSSNTSLLLGYTDSANSASIKNKFEKDDVLFGKLRPYLRKYLLAPFVGVCSSEIWVMKGEGITNQFLFNIIQTEYFIDLANQSTGSKMPRADWNVVSSAVFNIPALPEQQKIANFLSAVDEKIQQLTRKKELLEHYKKGVMQQLFSGKLRFKDENGKAYPKWEEKRLGDVAERVTRKNKENNLNVLTISAQSGLVSQLEYFNKSVSAKDVTNYYLLEKGEFAYNKSYSNGYPMGAIKRLVRYNKGVVSTLYICFKFHDTISLTFMEHYFENGYQNNEIEKVAQEGARNHGLLNIGVNDFFGIRITLPSLKEQQKIASYLSSLDSKIEQVAAQITQSQTFKKGLLQQMFV